MKYKSEIINEIIKTSGHTKSTLHYQSECVESWIEETKGSYPKLCDYEGEWLDYYLENDGIGKFPYLALTNITSGTVDNCVPIRFKSAILKGCTLVNLAIEKGIVFTDADQWRSLRLNQSLLNSSKKYLISFDSSHDFNGYVHLKDTATNTYITNTTITLFNQGNNKILITDFLQTELNTFADIRVTFYLNNDSVVFPTISNVILLEYVEGMENWDIPYFEGMTSVKMPDLTTTGKNLLKPNRNSITSIHLKRGTTLILSTKNSIPSLGGNVKFYDIDGNPIWMGIDAGSSSKKFTLPCDIYRIENTLVEGDGLEYQLEVGTVATPYEPYKTNILTVNEEVELRGIGEGSNRVEDELNLLTGELTQRVAEIVLDGSEDEGWKDWWHLTNTVGCYIQKGIPNNGKVVVNNIPYNTINGGDESNDIEGYNLGTNGTLLVRILKSKLSSPDLNGFKEYLASNPIVIQYGLTQESIKTVDLSITNQDGESLILLNAIEGTTHIETSSETIPPLLDIEVPVEAITQNLNSFIGEE